ncbi:type I secretion system permease/ATPase, partial [Methylobacterium sp. EM32]
MLQDAASQADLDPAGPDQSGRGPAELPAARPDSGLGALALVASFHQIPCEPAQVRHDLGLGQAPMSGVDIVRGARRLGLKGRLL